MSKTNTTTTTSDATQQSLFNQPSMSAFNAFQPAIQSGVMGDINDPFHSMFFNTQLGMADQALSSQNSSRMSANLQRMRAMGLGGNSALMNWQMRQNSLAGQSANSNMFNNLLLQGSQMRQNALNMAMGYRPLQTGQTQHSTQTQKQTSGGLGSWLPQVAGMAMNFIPGMQAVSPLLRSGAMMNSIARPFIPSTNYGGGSAPDIGYGGSPSIDGPLSGLGNSFLQ